MITSLDQVTEFPLCWPGHQPRQASRKDGSFKVAEAKARADLDKELRAWRITRWVLSIAPQYHRGPTDPGVAVWFYMPSGNPVPTPADLYVLACDRYKTREHNLRAIGLTFEALRAAERHGVYSIRQAVEGARAALPPPASETAIDWVTVLGAEHGWPLTAVEMAYRAKAERAHPDRGGTDEDMALLNQAIAAARKELAG